VAHVVGILASGVALVFAQPRAPELRVEPIRLEYQAGDSCADRSAFLAEVRARTQRMREARPDEPALVFDVVLIDESGQVTGRLRRQNPDGAASERTVVGASCANVIAALALIVALAIDPEASLVPVPQAPPAASRTPEPAPAAQLRRASAPHPAPPRTRWRWGFGAQTSVRSAVAPEALFAFGAYATIEARTGVPSARLSVQHAAQTVRITGGGGKIAWTDAHLDACPWGLRLVDAAALVPCVGVDGGVLRVSGVSTPNPDTFTHPWIALGTLLRLRMRSLNWLAVDAELGVGFPLVRNRYFLRPSTTVHDVPFVDVHAGLSLGILLP